MTERIKCLNGGFCKKPVCTRNPHYRICDQVAVDISIDLGERIRRGEVPYGKPVRFFQSHDLAGVWLKHAKRSGVTVTLFNRNRTIVALLDQAIKHSENI